MDTLRITLSTFKSEQLTLYTQPTATYFKVGLLFYPQTHSTH